MHIGLLKLRFRFTASENAQCVHLDFPRRHYRIQTSGTLPQSPTSDWGCLPRYRIKRPSRTVSSCGFVDQYSFMIHPLWCSSTFYSCNSEILEQRVSGTMDRARWTWFKSLPFYLWGHLKSAVYVTVGTSEVRCLCYSGDIWSPLFMLQWGHLKSAAYVTVGTSEVHVYVTVGTSEVRCLCYSGDIWSPLFMLQWGHLKSAVYVTKSGTSWPCNNEHNGF
jgi:hypothetical protein